MTRPRIRRLKGLMGREQAINAGTARPSGRPDETAETPNQGADGAEGRPSVVPSGEHLTSPESTPDVRPEPEETPPDEPQGTAPAGAEEQPAEEERETAETSAVNAAPEAPAETASFGAGVEPEQTPEADEAEKTEKSEKPEEAETTVQPAVAADTKVDSKDAKKSKARRKGRTRGKGEGGGGKSGRRMPRGVLVAIALILVTGATAGALIVSGVLDDDSDDGAVAEAPAPIIADLADEETEKDTAEDAASQLGFPSFATKNTTRIGGGDSATTAAGAALAVFPSAGGSEPPEAVALVPNDDWQAALAAAVLMAEPVRAPLLVTVGTALPPASDEALGAMSPQGSPATGGASIFAIGDTAAAPDGYKATRVTGSDPATVAAGIAKLRRKLTKKPPRHIVVTTSEEGGFAMPAAAWAARSGDPVLFAEADRLPGATRAFLKKNKDVPVYVLGPPAAISDAVLRQISRVSNGVVRVAGEDPVTNAIEFARFTDRGFGWNINDPGHGFVVARSDQPMDAGAAAPISASGTWGPLLLTEEADSLPGALRGYLLDVKPGYRTDPTRALYNRIWVIGDEEAIDVNQQAALDDLAELARIGETG